MTGAQASSSLCCSGKDCMHAAQLCSFRARLHRRCIASNQANLVAGVGIKNSAHPPPFFVSLSPFGTAYVGYGD